MGDFSRADSGRRLSRQHRLRPGVRRPSAKIARLKIFEFDPAEARPITQFGSERVVAAPLTRPDGDAHVVRIRIDPGGVLGRHAGADDQLFLIVEGEGWVSRADGRRAPVSAGAGVFWPAGEEHESGTDTGLTALVVESEQIVPRT